MAEAKTKPTEASVSAFIQRIGDADRREDCRTLLQLMQRASGVEPKMWGSSMIGFGSYHHKYASGHEGDCFLIGFAPRKQDFSLYIMPGFEPYAALLAKLGKHKTGKACLTIRRLADVDLGVLQELLSSSVKKMKKKHG